MADVLPLNQEELVDAGKLRGIRRKVNVNSEMLDKIVDNILVRYNRDLHEYMVMIRSLLREHKDRPLSDEVIENLVMKVPVFLYFAGSGLESLGIEGDTAKAVKLEVFNKAYLEAVGTVGDKTNKAEQESMPEMLVEVAFQRAYKKLKLQIEMGVQVFSGVKKIMTKRIAEIEVGKQELSYHKSDRGRYGDG